MTWIEIVWPMMGAASLTLGLMHLVIWLQTRKRVEHLVLLATLLGVGVLTIFELLLMRSNTPARFAVILRFAHIPLALVLVSMVWIVRVRFRAGRLWLAWAITSVQLLGLIPNFLTGQNLNFLAIDEMRRIDLIGNDYMYAPIGVHNPWVVPAELGNLALIVFLLDAAFEVWRRGDPKERVRALWVCGNMALFLLLSAGLAALVSHGLLHIPYLVNAALLGGMAAMSYDLGGEMVHSVQTVQRLRETGQRMDFAAAAADLGLFSWDVARDRIWLSDSGWVLFGFERGQVITRADLLERIHPEDRERIRAEISQSVESGQIYERTYRVVLPDSRVRWLAVRGRVERDDAGRVTTLYGVAMDLGSRHLAEQRFRIAVEAAPSAMLLVDAADRIVLANTEAERVFGYPRDELIGQDIGLLLPEAPRDRNRARRERQRAEPAPREIGARRKDGLTVPVEVDLSSIEGPEGALVLVSVTDISERVWRDSEAAQQRDWIAHLSRVATLGEFSGSLAHELNQPLAAILSNAQAALVLLRGGGEHQAELREALEDIVADDKRASDVIKRVRSMLKSEQAVTRPLDPNALVSDVLRLHRSDLLNRGVEIDLDLAPDLPDIEGDRMQLLQVLLNVVINACDAMESRVEERRIRIHNELGSNGMVRISVCDLGPGIEPARLARVFDPFVTSKNESLGLGLAVCRTIVRAHGGRLWAENTSGRGVCFRLELPIAGPKFHFPRATSV